MTNLPRDIVSNNLIIENICPNIVQMLIADKRSENTKKAYERDLTHFSRTVLNGDPTPELISSFLTLEQFEAFQLVMSYKAMMLESGLSEATVNRRLAAVRSLVNLARRMGHCSYDLKDVTGEKNKAYRDTSGVTVKQMKAMLDVPKDVTAKDIRDFAILRILWENALRRSEVVKLNVEDFNAEDRTLAILGKGRGSQKEKVSISEKVTEAVLKWLSVRGDIQPNEPLFIALDRATKGSKRITGEGLAQMIATIGKQAGISKKVTPHMIRHTSITAALEATNGNVSAVQKLSRHAKVETVMIYDDNRTDKQKEVTTLLADLF
ncbi:tyrosine-type recombinase/integrase [Lysinibacillus fusiformis]|uniref:tyrosine-type recombinase/integrase n=1 Tax=Lysinibacillus fusiformis TaxID=28031 RepID=UPI0011A3BF5D|nr:tyrosine-type recombinase/integrase [Lysinibacillus fusiformis]